MCGTKWYAQFLVSIFNLSNRNAFEGKILQFLKLSCFFQQNKTKIKDEKMIYRSIGLNGHT